MIINLRLQYLGGYLGDLTSRVSFWECGPFLSEGYVRGKPSRPYRNHARETENEML